MLASIGNSLKAEDVERGLRGAEDELRLHELQGSGQGHRGGSTFWVGEWGLVVLEEDEQEDLLEGVTG